MLGIGIWNIQRFMEDRKNAHAKVLKKRQPSPRHLCGNCFQHDGYGNLPNEKPVTATVVQGDGGA